MGMEGSVARPVRLLFTPSAEDSESVLENPRSGHVFQGHALSALFFFSQRVDFSRRVVRVHMSDNLVSLLTGCYR